MTPAQIARLTNEKAKASNADVHKIAVSLCKTYGYSETQIAETLGILSIQYPELEHVRPSFWID